MPDKEKINVAIPLQEIYPLLCEKCQLAVKKLLGEKLAEKVIKE